MAKKIDCGNFLVIETSRSECISFGGMAVCDYCNAASEVGYYIAVLNCWYCPKCFEEWKKRAKWYQEDADVEKRNYEAYSQIIGVKRNPMKLSIRKYLIRKIKMRVYKEMRSNGDYEKAVSFIVNAPLSEWRIRFWCVTHYRDQFGTGNERNWQELLDYITH